MQKTKHMLSENKKRKDLAALYGIVVVAATILFGGGLYLMSKALGVGYTFVHSCMLVFWLFSAFVVLAAFLLLFTNIPEDWALGFGAGLYYGTIACSAVLKYLVGNAQDRTLVAFVIVALVSYIVYEKATWKQKKSELADLEFFRQKYTESLPAVRLVEEFAQRAGMTVPAYIRHLRIQAKLADGMSEADALRAVDEEDSK